MVATYLGGSKSFCQVFQTLGATAEELGFLLEVSASNSLGHTVFDNLIIAVLKAHSSARLGDVDDKLKDGIQFPGGEVDICGR